MSRKFWIIFFLSGAVIIRGWAGDTTLVDMIHLPYPVKTIASDSSGNIWISSSGGLQRYHSGRFITEEEHFNGFIIAQNGAVINVEDYQWEVEQTGYYPWEKFEHWLKFLPGEQKYITAAQDQQGRIWVASGPNIYIFKMEDRFDLFFQGHSTRGMLQEAGHLYVNSYEGIYRDNERLFDYPPIFGEGYIEKIDGRLFFAWSGLISYYPLTGAQRVFHQTADFDAYDESFIAVVAREIRDTIWVGTNLGLAMVQGDSIVPVLDSLQVEDIQQAGRRFLIVTARQGVWEKRGRQFFKTDLPEDLYYHQILFRDGQYFFPTDRGLVCWDGKEHRVLTASDGLSDTYAVACLFDNEGFLWVSTLSGLNRINLESGVITSYLTNIEFNRRSFLKTRDSLYFGTVNGIYRLAPKDFLGDDIPQVQFNTPFYYVHVMWLGVVTILFVVFLATQRHLRKPSSQKDQLIKEKEKMIFLLQLEQFILQNDIPVTVGNLAAYLNVSERSLYRTFSEYGLTPGNFIRDQKLKKVKHLIEKQNIREVKELAKRVGYSEKYLFRLIKKNLDEDLVSILV